MRSLEDGSVTYREVALAGKATVVSFDLAGLDSIGCSALGARRVLTPTTVFDVSSSFSFSREPSHKFIG